MSLKIKREDLFLVFIYINAFCKGIGLSNGSFIYTILMLIGLCALGIKFTMYQYYKREIAWILSLLFVGIGSFILTHSVTFLITCICLSGMKNVDINKVYEGMYKIRLVCFVGVISLSMLGIVDKDMILIWRNNAWVTRYGMGYGHPNTLHLTWFVLVSLIVLCRFYELRVFHLLVIMVVNTGIYTFSSSRTGFLLVSVLITFTFFVRYKWFQKIILILPTIIFAGFLCLTFLLPVIANVCPQLTQNADKLMNGRIGYTLFFLDKYQITLLGTVYNWDGIIDNSYLRIYFDCGILGLLTWSTIIFLVIRRTRIEKNYVMAVITTCFLSYIFVESFGSNIFINYIMLYSAGLVFNGSAKNRKVCGNDNSIYTDIQ